MSRGPHAELLSPYFQHMKALITGVFALGDISVGKLKKVTAKELVWKWLQYTVMYPSSREIHFLILHNIVANKDKMHKFNMTASPNCLSCGVSQDNVHLFCECVSVREAWFWPRQRLLSLLFRVSSFYVWPELDGKGDCVADNTKDIIKNRN